MTETIGCEHCGTLVHKQNAQAVVADGWTHYFCSSRCKLEWGEQGEIEEDD